MTFFPGDDGNAGLFASINLFWLLFEHVKGDIELKIGIMNDLFGIAHIPDEVLPELAFFQSAYRPDDKKIRVGFTPSWTIEQKIFSAFLDHGLMFDLIGSTIFHEAPESGKRLIRDIQ